SLLHIYDVEQVRHSDPHLKTDNLTSRADAALLSVADSRACAGTRSWPGRAFSHRLSWRSSWALAPRWCRKARLIRRQLFWPDDGPLAVLPLKHHVPMPGLDPVPVDPESAEDGVVVHLRNGVADLRAVHRPGAPHSFDENLTARVCGRGGSGATDRLLPHF